MLNKKLMMLAIFLVSLLAVSAVSASDNATIDIASTDETTDEVVSVDDNQANLKEKNNVGTFTDLTEEVICETNDVLQVNGSTGDMVDDLIDPSIDFNANDIIAGETLEIKVFLPSDATGNVTVIMHNETYLSDVNDGLAVVLIDGLAKGANQNFAIYYGGDDKYLSSHVSSSIDVFGIDDYEITPSHPTITIGETARVVVNVPYDAKGIVALSVKIDRKTVKYESPSVNGTATFEISGFTLPNTYGFIAALTKDPKYEYQEATGKISVNPIYNYSMVADDVDVNVGETACLVVNLPEDAEGDVYFTIANQIEYATIYNGTAKMNVSNLEAGNHTFTVVYNMYDDFGGYYMSKYAAKTVTGVLRVHKIPIDDIIDFNANDIIAGETLEIKVFLPSDATGNVTVIMHNETYLSDVNDGLAVVLIDGLARGANQNFAICYGGDDKYLSSHVSSSIDVFGIEDYEITASSPTITFGETARVVVNVPYDAKGIAVLSTHPDFETVNYESPVVNGTATFEISGFALPTTYGFIAALTKDPKYEYQEVTGKITVKPLERNTIIEAPDVSLAYKDPNGELIATIVDEEGNPLAVNLNVDFNGKTYSVNTDSNGQAGIAIGTLSPGTYAATISYEGNEIYNASTATAKVTVTKADTIISAQDVSLAYKDPSGELVATIINEHGKPLVVNLNINFNGKSYSVRTDSNGQASIPVGILSPGTYTATISYKGSANYKASSTTAKVTVTKAGTIISATDVSLTYKDPSGELVATIINEHGKPLVVTLNVNFNGKSYSVRTDSNGQASIPVGTLSPGKYSATISYKGSANYKASSTTAKVTVTKAGTIISATDVSLAYKTPYAELDATIINEHGKPLVVTLNVDLNGKTYTAKTDSNGQASIPIGTLSPGKYTATISYKGSSNYKASSTTAKVTVTKADTIISAPNVKIAYKDPTGELVATIVNEHGKPLVVNLNVNINGKDYTVKTDSNGQASIAVGTLTPGTYTATISYKGSSNYKASSTTAKVTVTKADTTITAPDVTVAYKDPNGALVSTITNEHGKPLVVNLNVNLNGKTYSVKTDSNGQASVSTANLAPGTYTATISYNGSGNYKASSTTAKIQVK